MAALAATWVAVAYLAGTAVGRTGAKAVWGVRVARWEAREGVCRVALTAAVVVGAIWVGLEAQVGPAGRRAAQAALMVARGRGSSHHTRSRGGKESRRSLAVGLRSGKQSRSR